MFIERPIRLVGTTISQSPTTTSAFQSEGSGEQAATLSVMSSGGEMMYIFAERK